MKIFNTRCSRNTFPFWLIAKLLTQNVWDESKIAFIKLSLIIEGAAEKVSQFKMEMKTNDRINFCFNEQNFIFENYKKVETINNHHNDIIFVF